MTQTVTTENRVGGENGGSAVGYLLVGHGTRNPTGQQQLRELFTEMCLVSRAHALPTQASALAFLELAEPDIPTAIQRLFRAGVRDLVVVPVLLFSAGHAQRDIPTAVKIECDRLGMRILRQSDSLACDPNILSLSAQRFHEAVCSGLKWSAETVPRRSMAAVPHSGNLGSGTCPGKTRPACGHTFTSCPSCLGNSTPVVTPASPVETNSSEISPVTKPSLDYNQNLDFNQIGLAMIGRGSNSDAATADMLQFADKRLQLTPVAWSTTGFIHAQRPSVDEALDGLAATGLRYLVVQPHLLFEGELVNELRREVAYRQTYTHSQHWIITETLGADDKLADVICRLATQDKGVRPL